MHPRRRIHPAPLVIALICLTLPRISAAQDAFSRITVSGGRALNVGEQEIHRYWESGRGGELVLITPFYLGEVEAAFALHRYEVAGPDVPRFDALLTALGWGLDLSPFEVASWIVGMRVGNYRMAFDDDTFRGVRNESELVLGVHTRIDLHLTRRVGLYAAGRLTRTYTAPRFDTAYVAGGLSLTFDAPGWLRTILH